jgi:hypothetical protein
MPVIVKLSLLSLLALFTAVALLLPLAVTAQDSGNDTTNKNTNSTIGSNNDSGLKEQNLTNTGVENNSNAQTTPVERATARPARKPHFIFPDHIMSSVNATMTEKCMEIHV